MIAIFGFATFVGLVLLAGSHPALALVLMIIAAVLFVAFTIGTMATNREIADAKEKAARHDELMDAAKFFGSGR